MELTASQFDQLIGSIMSVKSELLAKQDSFEDKLCAIEGKLTKLDAIETSIESLKIKQEEQCAFNDSFNFKVAALKDENHDLNKQLLALKDNLKEEATARDDLERQQRRYNLELSGIAQADNENTYALVASFFSKLDSDFDEICIDVAHRKKMGKLLSGSAREEQETLFGVFANSCEINQQRISA